MIARLRRVREDDGFSLTELLVVVLLLGLVMSVVAGIYVSSTRTQVTVQTVSHATTQAQSAIESIGRAVRMATEVHQVDANTISARVPGSGSTVSFACVAWHYDAVAHRLHFQTFPDDTPIAAPSAADVASWTLIAENVEPVNGSAIYGWDGRSLAIAFQVSASDHAPVPLELTTTPLTSIEMETSRCV